MGGPPLVSGSGQRHPSARPISAELVEKAGRSQKGRKIYSAQEAYERTQTREGSRVFF